MGARIKTKDFIIKAKLIHGDRYNYSLVDYINNKSKVKIICPIHGVFHQIPNSHLLGRGCERCGIENQKMNMNEFISKARQVHGDIYNYSLVEYKNINSKISIICPVHGEFHQEPYSHLRGCGCRLCSYDKMRNDTQSFITKAKEMHGDKYDYSLVNYVNAHTKVTIICPEHGEFDQMPYSHFINGGCAYCGGVGKNDTQSFITKAKEMHGDKYDYSLVNYVNAHTKVTIICPEHGPFEQTPNSHLKGYNCLDCSYEYSISKQEIDFVNYIRSIYNSDIITNTRSIITPYELDVYLPDKKIAFEYNGMYWHNEGVTKPIGYHQMKTDMCNDKGINLYHIWESDWVGDNNQSRDKIKEIII